MSWLSVLPLIAHVQRIHNSVKSDESICCRIRKVEIYCTSQVTIPAAPELPAVIITGAPGKAPTAEEVVPLASTRVCVFLFCAVHHSA